MHEAKALAGVLGAFKAKLVCDYGAGSGRHVAALQACFDVYGFETDAFTRHLCAERYGVELLNLNFRTNPIHNVDAVYSMQNTLFCFDTACPNPLDIIKNTARHVRSGGLLAFEYSSMLSFFLEAGTGTRDGVVERWKPLDAHNIEFTRLHGGLEGSCVLVSLSDAELRSCIGAVGRLVGKTRLTPSSNLWVVQVS